METNGPVPNPGRFRWNRGGWFGSQLGGTAWMLVGAVVLVPHAPEVAGVWLACFAVANAIGSGMWWHRDRLRPYPALQALLLVCGVAGLVALVALHVLRFGLRITRPLGISLADEPRLILWLVVLVIGLMTWFHLRERGAKKLGDGPAEHD
jgi:ABC-type phosphate transport system permease subunit